MGIGSSKGDKGDIGPQGEKGPQGATGSQGPQGATGPKGQDGVLSIDSLNATQFSNLLTALASDSQNRFKGPQGATGPQGPQGATGSQGPQGQFNTNQSYTFTQPMTFNDITVNGSYTNQNTTKGTSSFFKQDGNDYAILTTKAGSPGGANLNINPVFGGNLRVGYNPNDFWPGGGDKDTTVPTSKLAVKGDINATDGFKTGDWKISRSGDNLCMQNGTNPELCVNKYGEPLNKYLISFPWVYTIDNDKKQCIDISKIGQDRPTSPCDLNDTKQQFYFEEGSKIKSADATTYKDKCLQYSNSKYNVSPCDYDKANTAYNEQLFGNWMGRIRPYSQGDIGNGCFDRMNSNNSAPCQNNDAIKYAAQAYTKVKV